MKSIDELIAELCPNGVEYKPLGAVCEIAKGEQLNRDSLLEHGRYPVINGGIEPSGYWDYYNFTKDYITVSQGGASAGYVNWIDSAFWAGAHCFVIERNESIVCYRYIHHILKHCEYWLMKSQVGAGIPSVSKEKLSQVAIPIPPLAVQKEIVRILDGFTGLIDELQAELTARRKQYEQYMDRILDYGDSDSYSCLGEVVLSLNTGLNPRQFFKLNTNDATNYYVTIREICDGKIVFSDKTDKINDTALSLCNKRSNLEVGDVLFSGTGTIGETAVIDEPPTNWNIKEGVYAVKPDSSKVLSRYLNYAFMCSSVRKAYGARIFGGTVKSISMKDLLKIKIPIPPLAEQKRIVEILDKFDALCNDETAGLVAEIAARKKQYEYYRDKLLTFKKAS